MPAISSGYQSITPDYVNQNAPNVLYVMVPSLLSWISLQAAKMDIEFIETGIMRTGMSLAI